MALTDPISDMLTRIRNAQGENHEDVLIPYSKMKKDIAKILKEEGFVKYSEVLDGGLNKKFIKLGLKYRKNGSPLISLLKRVSKPGKRVYVQKKEVPKVLNGFGVSIVSTSKGVLSGRDARCNNLGGELLAIVY